MTFRVSAEDYELLVRSCASAGARSVSEFARGAAFERIRAMGAPRIGLSGDLATLGKSLSDVDIALRELGRRIRRVLGPAHADQGGGVSSAASDSGV